MMPNNKQMRLEWLSYNKFFWESIYFLGFLYKIDLIIYFFSYYRDDNNATENSIGKGGVENFLEEFYGLNKDEECKPDQWDPEKSKVIFIINYSQIVL